MSDPNYDPTLDRIHTCHNPKCGKPCPPAMLACKPCWFKLPKTIRDKIWKYYRRGQEIDKRPSQEYMTAFAEAQTYWENN